MNFLEKFLKEVKLHPGYINKVRLLLAVSGGVDSVVLCDLISKSGYDFSIAHCNFQLRGEESEGDELFVRQLANKYNKELFVERFETDKVAEERKMSIQETARKLRYSWFLKLSSENSLITTTAHHADDNIETVVMNFFRGTGLKGLTGMDGKFPIYRPLLPFRKQEILAYAKDNNLEYREDSSNASSKYTRNFFRNNLLPSIQQIFPSAEENILHNIQRLTEVEQVYDHAIKEHKLKLVEQKGNEEHIPILKLKKTFAYRTILWEIIKDKYFTTGQIDEVIKLMDAENGSYVTSEFYRIIKNRKWLIISDKHHDETNEHLIIDRPDKHKTSWKNRTLQFEEFEVGANFKIPVSSNVACLDSDQVTFPLILRKWKQGDYFYPLGMRKKKKLSRFFIDQKLSKLDKEKVHVLEMNKKIIWVIGRRIDDRVKLQPQTKKVLKITFTPTQS